MINRKKYNHVYKKTCRFSFCTDETLLREEQKRLTRPIDIDDLFVIRSFIS